MARILFFAIITYHLYRLIFELIIPIFTTTKQVRNQFNAMRQQQDDQNKSSDSRSSDTNSQKPKAKVGEYIDFEEIKN